MDSPSWAWRFLVADPPLASAALDQAVPGVSTWPLDFPQALNTVEYLCVCFNLGLLWVSPTSGFWLLPKPCNRGHSHSWFQKALLFPLFMHSWAETTSSSGETTTTSRQVIPRAATCGSYLPSIHSIPLLTETEPLFSVGLYGPRLTLPPRHRWTCDRDQTS